MGPPHCRSTFQMQYADEREETARRIGIHVDLAVEPLLEERGAFVVQPSAAHIERLNLRGWRRADRLEIAFADKEIVLDHAPERRHRQHHAAMFGVVLKADVE